MESKEERKPTVEEMFEAYRQYRQRLEERIEQGPGIEVDFSALPSNRRVVRTNRIRTTVSAAIVAGVLILPTIGSEANACVLNQGADKVGTVEAVECMIQNQ